MFKIIIILKEFYHTEQIQNIQISESIQTKMNRTSLICGLVILVAFAQTCLTLKLNKQSHLVEKSVSGMQHRAIKLLQKHLQETSQWQNDLMEFAMSDPVIMDAIMSGNSLSEDSVNSVRTFLKQNQQFKKSIIAGVSQDQCVAQLNNSQQSKYVNIILDNMDFTTIFSDQSQQFGDQATASATSSILADKDIGPVLVECYMNQQM